MSLKEKKGWNLNFSKSELTPKGLLEPVWCKNNKWIITNLAIKKGSKKCNVKNRVSVALSTANPPQIHWTKNVPK